MDSKNRDVFMKHGLSYSISLMTFAVIVPAVLIGLLATAVYARVVADIEISCLLNIAAIGTVFMVGIMIPGTYVWRRQLRKRILNPLSDLGDVMVRAGAGDLTVRGVAQYDDEIGLLVNECNGLIESLANIAGNVRISAESVSNAASQLSASSQEISTSSIEISSSVQQIAHGAELQSRKVEETSSSMERMTQTVQDVANRAEEVSRTSEDAVRAALLGEQTTSEAISKIDEVRQVVETLAGSVRILGQRSAQVGSIVNVITSIADQTNLLSLNAAIEAARAGESGRGFSVVAEEVRKLAEGSGKAAEQIGELIKEVQAETSKALDYMEIGITEVAKGTDVVGRTADVLQEISEAVSRTTALAEDIASSMADQSSRTVDVDRAMHDIAAVVEENAASAQETAAAAEQQTACMEEISSSAQELADMAHDLEHSVHQFHIG